jgi:ferrous iron transport protein B
MTTIALAGNPNCGKTSLFNGLTGARQRVGNWAGVTVERRSGQFQGPNGPVEVVDLPGTYSLAAQSEDERIATRFLAGPDVDLIVNVLDASNLERNLYLTAQLLELGRPMLLVLNMADDAARRGLHLEPQALAQFLGVPVVATVGNRGEGLQALRQAICSAAAGRAMARRPDYGPELEPAIAALEREIAQEPDLAAFGPTRWLALHLLEGTAEAATAVAQGSRAKTILARVRSLAGQQAVDGATLLSEHRFAFARELAERCLPQGQRDLTDPSARLDRVLTHRWLGIPIFVAVMVAVYSLTFAAGKAPQEWINAGFGLLQAWTRAHLPPGELASLLADGILPGVGAVFSFVPVIMLLMGCVAFLEDTGYMARAAFIMDRPMHLMGLHGKSFLPLVMGTGCNVPAVQATRTIDARSDRLITILVIPLMSCSARLQIYILIAGTFFPPLQAALAILAMHFLGFGLAMAVAKALRLTAFREAQATFLMELPPYRLPVLKGTLLHMWQRASSFVGRAGVTIMAGAALIWFLTNYPGNANRGWRDQLHRQQAAVRALGLAAEEEAQRLAVLADAHRSQVVNSSFAAGIGRKLQPVLAPILDPDGSRPEAWKDGLALSAGFVAKEIVVSTMAVVHHSPAEGLGETLRRQSGHTSLTALGFMVFTLIYTPCLGTIGMILKESGSFLWAGFSLAYGLGLAWGMAWLTVLGGRILGLG